MGKVLEKIKGLGRLSTISFFILVGVGLFWWGLYILIAFQILPWLKYGKWQSKPLSDVVFKLIDYIITKLKIDTSGLESWLDKPESWQGLQMVVKFILDYLVKFLEFIPQSLTLFAIAFMVGILGGMVDEAFEDRKIPNI